MFPRHLSGLMWMEALWDKRVLLIITCSPYQEALMPRERQHRVTAVLKATPHEQSTLYAFIPPLYGLKAARIEGASLARASRRHEDETRAWILIFDNVPTPSTACGRATYPDVLFVGS